MRASDVSCDLIAGLIGRWWDGGMDDRDRDAYEQHLLFCPPCMVQNDKARTALTALGRATLEPVPADLHRELLTLLRPTP
jgi:hypothetical protein